MSTRPRKRGSRRAGISRRPNSRKASARARTAERSALLQENILGRARRAFEQAGLALIYLRSLVVDAEHDTPNGLGDGVGEWVRGEGGGDGDQDKCRRKSFEGGHGAFSGKKSRH